MRKITSVIDPVGSLAGQSIAIMLATKVAALLLLAATAALLLASTEAQKDPDEDMIILQDRFRVNGAEDEDPMTDRQDPSTNPEVSDERGLLSLPNFLLGSFLPMQYSS